MDCRENIQRSSPTGPLLRWTLFGIGLGSTALGILGLFLPLLPTVPLLLLAAACFARSSERCHRWLLEHPRFGSTLQGYLDGEGIPRRAKRNALLMLWLTLPTSALLFVPILWVQILLFGIALAVTTYLVLLPTRP